MIQAQGINANGEDHCLALIMEYKEIMKMECFTAQRNALKFWRLKVQEVGQDPVSNVLPISDYQPFHLVNQQ